MRALTVFAFATLTGLAAAASANSDAEFDALYEQAKIKAAGSSTPAALFQIARERSTEAGFPFKNMGHIANYLADDFSLLSRIQHDLLEEQCRIEGHDITNYLTALSRQDTPDRYVAEGIYARLSISYDSVWEQLAPQAKAALPGIIINYSQMVGVDPGSFCKSLGAEPEKHALALRYAALHPSRSEVLRAVSP